MSTWAHSRSCEVTGVMLCFEVWIPPTHTHTHTLSTHWIFSYESAELILIQIRSVLKGPHQYIDSFYEGHQAAITGHQGVPFGERMPRVTDEPSGDGGALELWACGREERGGWEGAYWVLDSLVKQSQINLLSNRAAATLVCSYCGENPPKVFDFAALENSWIQFVTRNRDRLNSWSSLCVIRVI